MRAMSVSLEKYRLAWSRYFEFVGGPASASFQTSVREGLKSYTSGDGTSVRAADLGIEGGAIIQVSWIVAACIPYFGLEPSDALRAWTRLENDAVPSFYWARQLVRALKKEDPATLARVFGAVTQNPDFARARELALTMQDDYASVLGQARYLQKLLSKRLKITKALKDNS